jgi:hypothetical protein
MKTLYVWPTCEVSEGNYIYWEGFIKLFNDLYHQDNPGSPEVPEKKWLARIEPYEKADIEVVVVGAPDCPYQPGDSHVMQIICKGLKGECPVMGMQCRGRENSYMPGGQEYNYGHTYFKYGTWCYGTIGYTPGKGHGITSCYGTPWIFPFALQNLFNEGAYPALQEGQTPIGINKPQGGTCQPQTYPCYDLSNHCPSLRQCYEFDHFSPMAENGLISVCCHPSGTMQVGRFTFMQNDKAIDKILNVSKRYNQRQVLARAIVHEMGHALLNKKQNLVSANHECDNPGCIMYQHFKDFDLKDKDFGPQCEHRLGGSMDIRSCIP